MCLFTDLKTKNSLVPGAGYHHPAHLDTSYLVLSKYLQMGDRIVEPIGLRLTCEEAARVPGTAHGPRKLVRAGPQAR